MQKPEVLAPAGDMQRLKTAVLYGADAVYLGGKRHSMRTAPDNFTEDQLREAVAFSHAHHVKVFYTCNTLPTNDEIEPLEQDLKTVADCGVDALIVSDIGVLMAARRAAPGVELHVSTQAGVTNYLTATELYRLGAKRVILARELRLEEIAALRRHTPPELEVECFVHGAMCMSFSGRCLISNYLTGRDANHGECAQPCRWRYHLVEEKRPGEYYPIFETPQGTYLLNAKDLCLIEYLDRLAEAGVTSFKIEGRAKSEYYVAVITNAYRQAVDRYLADPAHYQLPEWLLEEPGRVSHREYSTGFLFGRPQQGQCQQNGGYLRRWEVAAVVEGYDPARELLLCTLRNRFAAGDPVEALVPGGEVLPIDTAVILDEMGEPIPVANHAMMPLGLRCPRALPAGTMLRRRTLD